MKCDYCGKDRNIKQMLSIEILLDGMYYRFDICKWCAEEIPILTLIN